MRPPYFSNHPKRHSQRGEYLASLLGRVIHIQANRCLIFDLISDILPFGRLWYGEPKRSQQSNRLCEAPRRSHDALIRVYDEPGNVIETHEHAGGLKEW